MSTAMGFFSKGLKQEFETAVVNEPSGFEPLKFYCIMKRYVMQKMLAPTPRVKVTGGKVRFCLHDQENMIKLHIKV